jgi:hypothetical protein
VELLPISSVEPLDLDNSADRSFPVSVRLDSSPISVEKYVLNSTFRI